jgi:two-component system, LytTR family, response regulator
MGKPLTAVIIDDEAKARRIMEALLAESCPNVQVLDSAEDVLTGIKAINKHQPDIVFLDIEMPGYTGFQLLDFFDEVTFEVIFTTAYSEYALRAFQVSAVDYLLKPIQMDQLKHAVDKAEKLRGGNKTAEKIDVLKANMEDQHLRKIAVPTSQGLIFLQLEEIVYFEADGSYTHIFLKDGTKLLISKKIKEFESILQTDSRFYRTHRSFIVNIEFIKQYIRQDGGHIEMENGAIIHLARERKDDFNKLIQSRTI